jgi:Ca2+-binding RTX toxin-like protein
MRTISLTAVAHLGAALLAPVGTATAAGETCQGQAATIVGTPGGQITGTEGADVIVTNDAIRVDALGGDDLVCATGVRGGYHSVFAILGAGADTFIPSERGGSTIYAGTVDGTDTEADVIRSSGTGGLVISGMAGQPNADIIDLGSNGVGEVRWSGIQTAPGAVSVGPGMGGTLGIRSANGDVTMDASGTVTGADTALTWTGQFAGLGFTTSAEYGRFTFRGTSGTERVKVDAPTTYDRDIALGSGNYDLYESNSLCGKATRITGDGKHNQLLLDLHSHDRVRVDLSGSQVTATKAGVEESARVRGFNSLTVAAKRAVVIGTDRADYITVAACRTTIKGKKGRDILYAEVKYKGTRADPWIRPECSNYEATIDGGPGSDLIEGSPGDDRLIGGPGNDGITGMNGDDRLIGGPGRDDVNGKKGRDVCQGERVRDCEKRL